jgi:sulfoacetaldehyde acetyltransferase
MWGAEAVNQNWFYGQRKVGTTFNFNPDYSKLATELGATGIRCTTPEDVSNAMKIALEHQAGNKPTVIEVICTEELGDPFRRDAMKEPIRVLEKYKIK